MNDAPRLLVCRTCPRYEPKPAGDAPTRGAALGREIKDRLAREGSDVTVRVVNCLAGCKNPCNAALDAAGRYRLRFSRLEAPDIDALLTVLERYRRSADGRLDEDALPEALRDRLSAASPPRIGD